LLTKVQRSCDRSETRVVSFWTRFGISTRVFGTW